MHWPQHPPDLSMMLGRVLERTESTAETVREIRSDQIEIKQRLAVGDRKFDQIETKLEELASAKKPEVSAREKMLLKLVEVAIYLGVASVAGPEIAARLAGVK